MRTDESIDSIKSLDINKLDQEAFALQIVIFLIFSFSSCGPREEVEAFLRYLLFNLDPSDTHSCTICAKTNLRRLFLYPTFS